MSFAVAIAVDRSMEGVAVSIAEISTQKEARSLASHTASSVVETR
jgi:hypothetical protein